MTTLTKNINKNSLDAYQNKSPIDIEKHYKYINLPRKYIETITLIPQLDEKENSIFYQIPKKYYETKYMTYVHNIQAINNKDYLDWTLIYNSLYIDFIPNSLLNIMQKFYNINNKNILPFDATVNNYLPLFEGFKYYDNGFKIIAKVNNIDLKISLANLKDLSVTVDLFTFVSNEILQHEYVKNLEQDIENLRHDSMLSQYVSREAYRYKSKTILGFNAFYYWNVYKIDWMIHKKINRINEIKLYYNLKSINTSHIIIDANTIKLSNILLYLNNNMISNLEIENVNDRFYLIKLTTNNGIQLYSIQNTVISFIIDSDNNEDIKKIKFYAISQNSI